MHRIVNKNPERLVQDIVSQCTGCQMCKDLLEDSSCLFFKELYRLDDETDGIHEKITPAQLRNLVELCNMCGLCVCPTVRTDIRLAKDFFIAREGLKPSIRLLEDVQRLGKICGAYPRLANLLLEKQPTSIVLKRIAGIHPNRKIPKFPEENFVAWAKRKGLDRKRGGRGRKVAYFAGCTAQYLFPDVAKAAVAVLEHNGVEVYLPEQKCCGMPSLLEGDRPFTFELASFNLEKLGNAVDDGYDIVCSCPTCGYMLTKLLGDEACYSDDYRVFLEKKVSEAAGDSEKLAELKRPGRNKPAISIRALMAGFLGDDAGYFAPLSGVRRIDVASHTFDMGEYLKQMHLVGDLDTNLKPVPDRMAYFPPCHLREQCIGQPWSELLSLIPGLSVQKVGDYLDCCGMAGIMGFKQEFYDVSVAMGSHLMEKIRTINPERLLSDCLSCRIQFNQLLAYKVSHPVEILKEAYSAYPGKEL